MKPGRRSKSDRKAFPIVVLHESQTAVGMDSEAEQEAVLAAYNVTMSPHEWEWTTDQQAAMARYVLYAHQRLAAIGQLSTEMDLQAAQRA